MRLLARDLWRPLEDCEDAARDYQRLVEAVETTETCLKMLECKMERDLYGLSRSSALAGLVAPKQSLVL